MVVKVAMGMVEQNLEAGVGDQEMTPGVMVVVKAPESFLTAGALVVEAVAFRAVPPSHGTASVRIHSPASVPGDLVGLSMLLQFLYLMACRGTSAAYPAVALRTDS